MIPALVVPEKNIRNVVANKITTIIFDYGGVLGSDSPIYFHDHYSDFREILQLTGVAADEAKEV